MLGYKPVKLSAKTVKTSKRVAGVLRYLLLLDLAFVLIFTFVYMVSTSLKSYSDIHNASVQWIPTSLHLQNFVLAAKAMRLEYSLFNSVLVTALTTIGHVLSCTFIGYGFARFHFPLKKILFFGVILSATIPIQTMIVPLYVTYSNFGMLDTFFPLILPTFFGFGLRGGVFIFLFRQFFMGFPSSLEEAALIDGCGRIRSFFKIALPSAGSALIVCLVLSMVWHWNDYYEPSAYLSATAKNALVTQLLPDLYRWISMMAQQMTDTQRELAQMYHKGVVMAATAIAIAPLMAVYAFLQKKFMVSVERSGLVG